MVSCGSGGGLTELIDDVVTERAPVDRPLAASMLDRLRIRRFARDDRGPAASRARRGLSRALLRARAHGAVAPLRLRGESRQVDAGRRGRRGRPAHHRGELTGREPRRRPRRRSRGPLRSGPQLRALAREEPMRGRVGTRRRGEVGARRRRKDGDTPPRSDRSRASRRGCRSPAGSSSASSWASSGPGGGGQHHGYRARADDTPSAGRSSTAIFGPGLLAPLQLPAMVDVQPCIFECGCVGVRWGAWTRTRFRRP